MKRKRGGGSTTTLAKQDAATNSLSIAEDQSTEDEIAVQTPSKRHRKPSTKYEAAVIVKRTPTKPRSTHATPKSQRTIDFDTPTRATDDADNGATPSRATHADRSARRKTSQRLIERTLEDVNSEDEISDSDEDIAQELLDDEEDLEDEGSEAHGRVTANGEGEGDGIVDPETPSKRRRGRPKGRSRKRSPTPPQNLPPHEQYFWQNRAGGNKTSNNTFSSHDLLNHDDYFQQMQNYDDPHQEQRDFLLSLHARSFPQWQWELEQGFNICLYGYGSKRQLLTAYATYLHEKLDTPPKTIVVNGYAPGITIRDVFSIVASTLLPSHLQLPMQPQALLSLIIEALSVQKSPPEIFILFNSIDATSFRRPATQQMLATLAAHQQVSLIVTADTLNFPLLWDTSLRSQFHFLFHDTTTFAPYSAELEVVESVNDLLGRSGRRGIGGKDGVAFVLRSLPSNARSLFRVLVAEQVAASFSFSDEGQDQNGAEMGFDAAGAEGTGHGSGEEGVEYRLLYRKACEELICTNESGFRTLLKEFFDHQMVESRRDALGTERLIVPFRREELEGLLEELVD